MDPYNTTTQLCGPPQHHNSVVWVVPTHEPRFDHYRAQLASIRRHVTGISTAAVLSWNSEVGRLSSLPDLVIVLEDYFSRDDIEFFIRTRSIINVKKLFAVKILENSYSHIIVSDSELLVYGSLSAEDILTHNITFPFHQVEPNQVDRVIAAPVGLLQNMQDRQIIMRDFVYSGLYGWFADLPVYESIRLEGFWRRYGLETLDDFYRLNFETFDYIMYQYHVHLSSPHEEILKIYDWDSNLIPSGGSLWELAYLSDAGKSYIQEDAEARGPLWVSHSQLVDLVPSAKMIFNTDRDYTPKMSGTLLRLALYAKKKLVK